MVGSTSTSTTSAAAPTSSTSSAANNNGWSAIFRGKRKEQEEEVRNGRENGFEAWGGYMAAKKAKLDVQLNANVRNGGGDNSNGVIDNPASSSSGSDIFKGISIWINGYTEPPEPELRRLFVEHGGTFHPYRSSRTTYVIATNLSFTSKNLYGSITVKPEWITHSIAAGQRLDYRKYLLYDLNMENKQHSLTQFFSAKHKSNQKENPTTLNGNHEVVGNNIDVIAIPENQPENGDNEDVPNETDGDEGIPSLSPSTSDPIPYKITKLANGHTAAIPVEGNRTDYSNRVKMATEDGFLEDFFQHSRLHLISEQKKEMQNKIGNLRKNMQMHDFDFLQEFKEEEESFFRNRQDELHLSSDGEKILFHVDLDCFFVSVGLLSRPHLRGKPIAVTHSTGKGNNSKSDIASASYEARSFGVRNGMWVSEAKKVCPDLQVIPYDFEEYKRVSEHFFDIVARITLDIEPSSVDEMVLDATSIITEAIPFSNAQRLAEFIRRKINEGTQCSASIGIGSNKLLAKLATKKAKPNGVYQLNTRDAATFISSLEVREIPGIGWSHESKLEALGVTTCQELLAVPTAKLKAEFGSKTAEKMIQSCHGKDSSELKYGFDRPKSISVDVNYGIRFTEDEEVTDFLMKLSKELSSRIIKAKCSGGLSLTFRILARKKGAGDPKKHGGHGEVDSVTKSMRFFQHTRDWSEIFRNLSKMHRLLAVPPSDYRGIGVSLSDLQFEFDEREGENKKKQRTLFEMTSVNSRAKQMLTKALEKKESKSPAQNSSNGQNRTPPTTPVKRRKLNFVVKTPPKLLHEDKIDVDILRELPEEIAKEVAQQYGINLEDDRNKDVTADKNKSSNNPYAEIDRIDPAYLCALPESIRKEVLLQFQQAKGHNQVATLPAAEEQPCSSRQAMERDKLKTILQPEEMPLSNGSESHNLKCNENSITISPPHASNNHWPSSSDRTSTNQNRHKSKIPKDISSPLSSRRNLFQNEEGTNKASSSLNLDSFWTDPFYRADKFIPANESLKVSIPWLQGASDVEDVRNTFRFAINMIPSPSQEEKKALFAYFTGLLNNGLIKNAEVLLKFISRQVEGNRLRSGSEWHNVFTEILITVQEQFVQLYGYEVDLDNVEF